MDILIEEDESVSELRHLKSELNEIAPLSSAYLNAIWDMVFLIHDDGTYLDYQVKNESELFVPPEKFLGRNVREVMPPRIADEVFHRFRVARKSGSAQCLEYKLEKDGVENLYECCIVVNGDDKFLSIVRNITEQKRYEKELAGNEKRFEAQYRNNPLPTYIWRKRGSDFVLIDYNYAAATANQDEREKLIGVKASERYAEYPVIFESFHHCYNGKRTVEIELPYFPSTASEEKYLCLTFIFIPQGMVMIHVQDLTHHKRVLKALHHRIQELQAAHEEISAQHEEIVMQNNELKSSRAALETEKHRYRELFDFATEGYLITNRKGVILEANRAVAEMLEIERNELPGCPIAAFIGSEERKAFRTFLSVVNDRNAPREIEIVLLRNRREKFQAAVTVSYITSEDEKNLRWVIRDITQRKRAERELRQSEDFNRSIIESSNDCIKILDLEGSLLYLNPKGQELLEMEDLSCIGSHWLDFWNELDRAILRPEIENAMAGGIGRFQGHCPTARGTSKWWDVQINPIADADGRVERLLVISRDITDQKLAAERLLQKERFFRSLIENSYDVVTVMRLDGTIFYESPSCERILGYRLEERIGQTCFDYVHPDDRDAVKQIFDEVVANEGLSHPVEYRYLHKNGSYVSLEVIGQISTDDSGNPIVIVNKRDITERKMIEEKLLRSEELYRNVVETQTELICRSLPDTTLTFVNEAYCRYFGKSREELIGTKFLKLLPKATHHQVKELLKTLIANRQNTTYEGEVLRGDGSVGWQRWINSVILDAGGNVIELQGIGRDITEQKAIEEKLRNSEELYRTVVETQSELICRYLPDTTLTFVNDAYCRFFGKSCEELIGRKFIEFIPENVRPNTEEFMKSLIAIGESKLLEHEVILPDGNIGWHQWIDHVISDSQGNVIELQGIGRDITAQKQATENLRESEERFSSFMNNSPVAAWIDDEDGRILFLNSEYRKSIKLPEGDIIGKSLDDVFPPRIAHQYHSLIKATLDGEITDKFITEIIRADNSTGTFLTFCFPLINTKEGKRLIGGFAIDITEQQFIKKALTESEERYRQIVNTMMEGIWIVDAEMRIVFVNEQLSTLLGYSIEELLGQSIFEFYDEVTRARAPGIVKKRRKGIGEHYDAKLRRKDGSFLWVIVSATPYFDANGEFAGSMALVTDITERKHAEEALRGQEQLLRGFIEQIPDGTINVLDRDLRYMMAEGRELEKFGFSSEGLKGKLLSEIFPKETIDFVKPFYDRAFAGEEVWFELSMSEQFHSVCALPLHDQNNYAYAILVVSRNITEQKQKEEKLQQLSARLLNLQDDERRRLARELHDETAQTLAALGINLAAMKKMVSPDDEKALNLLQESVGLTQKSLREVRTLSYLLHPPMLDEGGLVSALKWFINGFSARSGIIVEFLQNGEVGRLSSDIETALYRIVQEGLTNINRHSGSRTARVELIKSPDKIILLVKDNGIGMPVNLLDKAENEHSRMGVGIPGMRERLRLLGGNLEIDSDKKGTTLIAAVPLEESDL